MHSIDFVNKTSYGWELSGWAFDDEYPDKEIVVSLPGVSKYTVTYFSREDVMNSIGNSIINYKRIGFNIKVYEDYTESFLLQFSLMEPIQTDKSFNIFREKSAKIKNIITEKNIVNKSYIDIPDINPLSKSRYDLPHYHEWWQKKKITAEELKTQAVTNFSNEPLISFLVPLYNTDKHFLKEMIDSVINQSYTNWQLCLADGSTEGYVWDIIQEYVAKDNRIVAKKITNSGISGNTNECLTLADGKYIALLDHDDFLEPNALFEVVSIINKYSDAEFIYSDEDKFNITTNRYEDPHLKPDFSWRFFYLGNFICHFTVIKRELLDRAGGTFDPECDGAQDYDMFLRCIENTQQIYHIPKILYHWRIHEGSTAFKDGNAKPYAYYAGVKALQKHIARKKINAVVQEHDSFYYDIIYQHESKPKVSIIIEGPLDDAFTSQCISSVCNNTNYENYEILVLDNTLSGTNRPMTYCYNQNNYIKDIKIYCLTSNVMSLEAKNLTASVADGEFILFLDKHVTIQNNDWLEKLMNIAQYPNTGAVSGELYYPDNTICYGLMLLRKGGWPVYHGKNNPANENDDQYSFIKEASAVSGAMFLVNKDLFLQLNGFDKRYSSSELAAIDLCLRLREHNKHIIFNPHAKGYIYKGNNDERISMSDKEIFTQAHLNFERDIFYNPNYSLKDNQTLWYLKE